MTTPRTARCSIFLVQLTAGMRGAYSYNATCDTARLLTHIHQSFIRAHTGNKYDPPNDKVRRFLTKVTPYCGEMQAFIEHVKRVAAADAEWSADKKAMPAETLDCFQHAAKPSYAMLVRYYSLPEDKWFRPLLPEVLLHS